MPPAEPLVQARPQLFQLNRIAAESEEADIRGRRAGKVERAPDLVTDDVPKTPLLFLPGG